MVAKGMQVFATMSRVASTVLCLGATPLSSATHTSTNARGLPFHPPAPDALGPLSLLCLVCRQLILIAFPFHTQQMRPSHGTVRAQPRGSGFCSCESADGRKPCEKTWATYTKSYAPELLANISSHLHPLPSWLLRASQRLIFSPFFPSLCDITV